MGVETLQEDLDQTEDHVGEMAMETEVNGKALVDRRPPGRHPMEDRLVEMVVETGTFQDQVGLAATMTCCCRS